jgi:hypothetical protein
VSSDGALLELQGLLGHAPVLGFLRCISLFGREAPKLTRLRHPLVRPLATLLQPLCAV